MTGLPDVEKSQLETPREGEISLAVQRHMFPTEPSFHDRQWLHEQRAKLIHNLAEDLSLEVRDWGNTDDLGHPAEIAEGILISIAGAAIFELAKGIVSWIRERKKSVRENDGVLAVKLKRSDGMELTIRGSSATRQSELVSMIQSFLGEMTKVGE